MGELHVEHTRHLHVLLAQAAKESLLQRHRRELTPRPLLGQQCERLGDRALGVGPERQAQAVPARPRVKQLQKEPHVEQRQEHELRLSEPLDRRLPPEGRRPVWVLLLYVMVNTWHGSRSDNIPSIRTSIPLKSR